MNLECMQFIIQKKKLYYNSYGTSWQKENATMYNIDDAIQKRRSIDTQNVCRIHRIKIRPKIKQIDIRKI